MANEVEKRITAKYILDSTGFNEGLVGINKNLTLNQAELKKATVGMQTFGKSSDSLKNIQDSLTKQLELENKKVTTYKDLIDKATTKMNDNIKERDKLKQSVLEANQAYVKAIDLYGEESVEAKATKKAMDDLTKEYDKADKTVLSNAKSIQGYNTNLTKAETAVIRTKGELNKINTELDKSNSKWLAASKSLENASKKMEKVGSGMSSVGNTMSVGVTAPIVAAGVAITKLAMDAVESENLFEVSMGDMAKSARDWSEKTSKALGLNAYAVRENIGTFNVMLTSMGQSKKAALSMSEGLTQLAYDMASFYNLKPEEAFEKLKSGISGETEPLKALGILINDTQVKTYALSKGIIKQGQDMTDAQKVQARYGLIMQATSKAQGDLSRTMDSPTNKLRIETEQTKQAGIELGTKLLPLLNKGLDIIKPIVDHLNNMTDAQQEMLLKTLMVTAAVGPLLSIGGKTLTVGSSVVGVIGKIAGALGKASIAANGVGAASTVAAGATGAGGMAGLGSALGAAAIAAGPWLVAGAAVVGTGYLIHKEMTKEVVPSVNLFADSMEITSKQVKDANGVVSTSFEGMTVKIDENTKTAVGSYVKMDDDVTKTLTDLYVKSTTLTDKNTQKMMDSYKLMASQIKAGMDKHYNDEYTTMQQFYQKSSALSAGEEQKSLNNLKTSNVNKKTEIDNYVKQIQSILNKASIEKRSLTLTEQQTINTIQDKMKTNAVKALSDTEVESKVILERLKSYGTRITAEQASNIIQNANKTRDKAVSAANDQYSKTVANIIRMRDESHSITADQAEKLIADANRQKTESINKAEEMRSGVVAKLQQMNSETVSNVDTSSGKILTWWDKLKRWWSGWTPDTKDFTFTVSSRKSQRSSMIPQNASGTDYFPGGLTTLHERGYEVYNLPRGTKIYNHEASEDLVLQTAESVASKVANNILSGINTKGGTQTIIVPVYLDGKQIAQASAPYSDRIQGGKLKLAERGVGIG